MNLLKWTTVGWMSRIILSNDTLKLFQLAFCKFQRFFCIDLIIAIDITTSKIIERCWLCGKSGMAVRVDLYDSPLLPFEHNKSISDRYYILKRFSVYEECSLTCNIHTDDVREKMIRRINSSQTWISPNLKISNIIKLAFRQK